ncbi:TetR/AcrR family transcriptional regulator [Streptomyces sp. NPDC090075]|uniref:TetR/AcrR family transcriptional regulator n=1 Tax=Streptomyces sp. NPDC090075 TaxID=3365937 RepID=UPI0038223898
MTTDETRRHIQQTALELFAGQGYEKTSLREIAERLGLTKAAVYYHFKAKEDILTVLFDEWIKPIEEVIEWGRAAPPGPATKQEVLRRYHLALARAGPLFRLFEASKAEMRDLAAGTAYRDTMIRVLALLTEDGAGLHEQIRCAGALLILHGAVNALDGIEGTPEEKHAAILDVALGLLPAHARD